MYKIIVSCGQFKGESIQQEQILHLVTLTRWPSG